MGFKRHDGEPTLTFEPQQRKAPRQRQELGQRQEVKQRQKKGRILVVMALIMGLLAWAGMLNGGVSQIHAAEPDSRQLLPPGANLILEIRQPQIVFQHAFVRKLRPIIEQSRGYQDIIGNPDFDIIWDSVQHFEGQMGISLPQIIESCAGESLLISATVDQPQQFAAIVTGRDSVKVSQLPDSVLSLARKIVSGRGQNLPNPIAKKHRDQEYFQFGELCYALAGPQWLLSNRESTLQEMLDRRVAPSTDSIAGIAAELANTKADTPGVRLIADLASLKRLPNFAPVAKWPPPEIGPVILAAGWLDLVQRSSFAVVDLDLGHDKVAASVRFPARAEQLTPGTVGYFASEPRTAAAPLLHPPHVIYSASWFRDYSKMWENRDLVPLPDQVKMLETQIASVEKGNLGYSGFDMIRLLGAHHRVVVTRPGPSPYRVDVPDRLPAVGLVLEVRDAKEFTDKVLAPIQRILGIVAVTNKMVIQTIKHQSAEISALRFTEDPAAVQGSDRVRYNFEPSYTVSRGNLIVGSSSFIVRALIDDLDRIANQPAAASETLATGLTGTEAAGPGVTEQQSLELGELSQVLTDIHGLAVRNSVLNDGLTIQEAETELGLLQRVISSLGQMQVRGGFDVNGFEYRITFAASKESN